MAKLSPLTFRIAKLWGAPQGTVEKHSIDQKISYAGENLDLVSNLKAELMLIKMKDELSAIITDATIDAKLICQLCLKPFTETINIPSAERQFLFHAPSKVEDELDVYIIDRKMMTIDLSEMMRQEIILHFPLIPVCSKGCKGLCSQCGKDRNIQKCTCKRENSETYKPFANLKTIVNKSKK